ncbi:hypothetical protein AYL99_00728 [Fonsecaea erecta]|uniref:non-specific serine/threonine protein kinase n=1 Tax=Fonsecaea erecta TaxID=1367422 RepID=A0A178ZZE8_9EURO|nr:hypothetical protein AYL99_00728 [Fonsecaea erecta]OAP64756.1 hypothetical protein AYL99_00728 [Fonsecaea erecta]
MPVQGKRLDGQPFDLVDFGELDDFITRYRARLDEQRQVPGDIDQLWYDDRKERGALGRKKEDEFFLRRWLYFEKDEKEDAEWGPIRLLGRGGYGIVGLWQKRDDNNQLVDEVVLKESSYTKGKTAVSSIEVNPVAYPRHLVEAAIHNDINLRQPGVSPHLREYKFFYDDRAFAEGRYRFYLEYCPHGSLARLAHRYRCWDTYLPEVFIWHVFSNLAKAGEALRNPPHLDSRAIKEEYLYKFRQDELFCLHLDWKPANVLLGYPHEGEEYPSALLNDYGLAMVTAISDSLTFRRWNPYALWWRGTPYHKPTEQSHYGVNWEIPPDGGWVRTRDTLNRELDWQRAATQREDENEKLGGDVLFDHSMNIYGIGQIMFEMVTLRKSEKHLEKVRAKTLKRFRRNGNHQISHVYTKKPGAYSSRLRHLIHRCLDPDPANRPSQLELMDQTRRGLRLAIKRAKRAGEFPVKVYPGHDINNMPLGDAGFRPTAGDFKYMIESEFVDPDAPRLKLPAAKYSGFPEGWFEPSWKKLYDQQNPHDRWFNGLQGHGAASPPGSSQVGNDGSHESGSRSDSDDDDDDGNNGGNNGSNNTNNDNNNNNNNNQQQPQNQAGQFVQPRSPPKQKRVRFIVQDGNLAAAP